MNESANPIHAIRHAEIGDCPELARLFSLLGHQTSVQEIMERWESWSATTVALVAPKSDGLLAGVATLSTMVVLHRPQPVGRITALVVDKTVRGRGIGRALVAAAEETLVNRGCGLVEVTSNDRLVQAHAFYEHLGYERTSIRLVKDAAH